MDIKIILEVWNNLLEVVRKVKKDYNEYCRIMNDCGVVKYIGTDNLIEVVILDDVITKCECELNVIKYMMNVNSEEEFIVPVIKAEVYKKKIKAFDSYLLYSVYIDKFIKIVNDILDIDYDKLVPVISIDVAYLSRFVTTLYQISKSISYYINSNKLEILMKKTECDPDEIEPLELIIKTEKDEIDKIINDYQNGIIRSIKD